MPQTESQRQQILRTLLIVMVGQVGCVTLLVILASVFAGMWLDSTFHTKPLLTIALLLAGVPISVVLMLQVARRTLRRLMDEQQPQEKESPLGGGEV